MLLLLVVVVSYLRPNAFKAIYWWQQCLCVFNRIQQLFKVSFDVNVAVPEKDEHILLLNLSLHIFINGVMTEEEIISSPALMQPHSEPFRQSAWSFSSLIQSTATISSKKDLES